jgi:transposase
VDTGKAHHHCVVIDAEGRRLLSRRVANDEPDLEILIADVAALGEEATWTTDMAGGGAALLIGLLAAAGQQLLYLPGHALAHAAGGYRGEGKTDARDAAIIADQARMRRDLQPLRPGDEITAELKILTERRKDLSCDRTRVVNRMRGLLTSIFPALERELSLTSTGLLVLLTGYQAPAAIRRMGAGRLEAWLRARHVRGAAGLAGAACAAAARQHTVLPGETLTASLIADLAKEAIALGERLRDIDKLIEDRFRRHRHAHVIISMPGIGPLLGAEFLAAAGRDMAWFANADRLAGFAGLAPAPWDSGRIRGNLHRPRRYHRGLNRVFCYSAMISIRTCPESKDFYDRKRAEGKKHTQAVLALARRRVNVLWALLRDNRAYEPRTARSREPQQPGAAARHDPHRPAPAA